MNAPQAQPPTKKNFGPLILFAILGAVGVLGIATWSFLGSTATDTAFVTYTVTKGDLPIVITERGNLQAQVETKIQNKVETIHDRGSSGTQIIFIVENGSSAKGPPPPNYVLKLEAESLHVFPYAKDTLPTYPPDATGNLASLTPTLTVPLATKNPDTFDDGKILFLDKVVRGLNDGRVIPNLKTHLADQLPDLPEIIQLTTVEIGLEWTISSPGDLLIELDSSSIRDRIEAQEVTVQKALSEKIQSESRFANQGLQNETSLAKAILDVKLAELQLQKFIDPLKGDHQIALEEVQRDIDDQNNKILEARTELELQDNQQTAFLELFKRGYKGKGDLDRVRSAFLGAETGLVANMNRLETLQSQLDSLKQYDREMQELDLTGKHETAKRDQKQVENDNMADLQQAKAERDEAVNTAEKEVERLERYTTQLEYCLIYAPHDGMVVYSAQGRRGEILVEEGATVRERQGLLTLPDLSLMQVKTQVHEAVLDQVRAELPVTVRLDAFPDVVYSGSVSTVAVVPQHGGYGSSGAKTYETIILINDEVENLKPGMTAVCEIHVDRLKNVLTIPVTAVVQRGRKTFCYLDTPSGPKQRQLVLGRTNDKFIEIKEGLQEHDVVVLNPMSILPETEDSENEIAPEGDEPDEPTKTSENGPSSDSSSNKAKPAAKKPQPQAKVSSQQKQMLERFQKMSPEEKKKAIEAYRKNKAAGGGS